MQRSTLKVLIKALLVSGAVWLPGATYAACNAPVETVACPLQAGPLVFDRCFGAPPLGKDAGKATPAGNAACNAIRDTKKAVDAVSKSIDQNLGGARRDMDKAIKRVLQDAIDKEALEDYAEAARFPQRVASDITKLMNDRQCGVNGTIKRIDAELKDGMKAAREGFEIGQRVVAVIDKQKKSLDELQKISNELNTLKALAVNRGPEAKRHYDEIVASITAIGNSTTKLAQTDIAKAMADGTAMLTAVGPFVTNSITCASTISAAIAGMGSGSAVTVGGVAACAPTEGASCALAAVGGIAASSASTIGAALSAPACNAAAADSAKIGEHLDKISAFVDGVAKLAANLPENAEMALKASQALVKLAEQLGQEAERPLANIEASFNRIIATANEGGDALERDIAPRIAKLANSFVKDMGEQVAILGTCFNKLVALSEDINDETFSGMKKLGDAVFDIVDAGKIVDNAGKAINDAYAGAEAYVRREHRKMNDELKDLHHDVWGVNPGVVDLGKTVPHLIAVATNESKMRKIAKEAGDLIEQEKKVIAGAVEAGKQAFLNGDKLKPAKAKYAEAKKHLKAAKIDFAQAQVKGKAKASQIARFGAPATHRTVAFTPVKVQKVPPLSIGPAIARAKPKGA